MDLLQHLEELAIEVTRYEQDREPSADDLLRWNTLFGYSAHEARDIIIQARARIATPRLSDEQWHLIKTTKEAEGYDYESYEHQLELWSTSSSRFSQRRASDITATYIFKLGGPFTDVENLQRTIGILAEAKIGNGEEGDARFACVDGHAKSIIEEWFKSQPTSINWRPTFIRLSQSPKELSDVSIYPTVGIDSTMPQHRLKNANQRPFPTQTEYPVWYFFYGTLMDWGTLQKCISLPYRPRMIEASIQGGRLRSWRGKYKGLVDAPAEAQVRGFAFEVESAEQEDCLRFRETDKYEVVRCSIALLDDLNHERVKELMGLTFRFRDEGELDME
ncbi:MAG: hypothetical protein L6R41_001296 [Letrouitia leprolyta]|nr:MAG: hypothetical protein L6R41_001296 [Letrouitia leprolyta]